MGFSGRQAVESEPTMCFFFFLPGVWSPKRSAHGTLDPKSINPKPPTLKPTLPKHGTTENWLPEFQVGIIKP